MGDCFAAAIIEKSFKKELDAIDAEQQAEDKLNQVWIEEIFYAIYRIILKSNTKHYYSVSWAVCTVNTHEVWPWNTSAVFADNVHTSCHIFSTVYD